MTVCDHTAAIGWRRHLELEDSELVLAARGGDREAFSALVARHRGGVGAVVLSLLGSPLEAEDVVQDALLRRIATLAGCATPRGSARG